MATSKVVKDTKTSKKVAVKKVADKVTSEQEPVAKASKAVAVVATSKVVKDTKTSKKVAVKKVADKVTSEQEPVAVAKQAKTVAVKKVGQSNMNKSLLPKQAKQ